jgi:glycosyltransferase involved in cell wall biosynthesis
MLPKPDDVAVRAIRLLIDQGLRVRLHIVGDGECRPGIERLVGELELADSVVFLGERRGGAHLHRDFDISLSTSDSEGSPNSVLEAMAAGRPVVATDVGGTRDLIRSGVDGLLVPAASPEAIAAALRDVISDQTVLRRFGASGRDRAIRDFSPAAIQATLTTLYRRVASGVSVPQATSAASSSHH